jgi:hypothetical protein
MQKMIQQTNWKKFFTHFNVYLQTFHNDNYNSNFSKHLLENHHPIDTTDNIIEMLYTMVQILQIEEYIYEETRKNNQLNDQTTTEPNAIFRALFQQGPETRNSHPYSIQSELHQLKTM